jgi:hypothetical protein
MTCRSGAASARRRPTFGAVIRARPASDLRRSEAPNDSVAPHDADGRGLHRHARENCHAPDRHFASACDDVAAPVSGRAIRHRVAIDRGRQDRHLEDALGGADPRGIGRASPIVGSRSLICAGASGNPLARHGSSVAPHLPWRTLVADDFIGCRTSRRCARGSKHSGRSEVRDAPPTRRSRTVVVRLPHTYKVRRARPRRASYAPPILIGRTRTRS